MGTLNVNKLFLSEHFSDMNVWGPTPVEAQATTPARLHVYVLWLTGLVNECSYNNVLVVRYKISVQAQEEIYI